MLSESAAREKVIRGGIGFPPLQLNVLAADVITATGRAVDWVVELSWGDERVQFGVEYIRVSTPKNIRMAIDQMTSSRDDLGFLYERGPLLPMIMAPFLGKDDLEQLVRAGLSGIDFSGNGVVIVSDKWLVYRSGEPNLYPSSATIKRIYQGKSSLVGRVLIVEPRFSRITDLKEEIEARGAAITLGTVSKVLSGLDQDLIVSREDGVTLLQPDLLLDRLAMNYDLPNDLERNTGRLPDDVDLPRAMSRLSDESGVKIAASGMARYGQMPSDRSPPIYVESFEQVAEELRKLGFQWTRAFANSELLATRDPLPYFDRRKDDGVYWTSPVQTYLELANGGKREQEIANEMRPKLLRGDFD